jgi:hypothetical protein
MDLTCLLTLSVSYSSLLWSPGKGLVVKTTLVHTTIDFLFIYIVNTKRFSFTKLAYQLAKVGGPSSFLDSGLFVFIFLKNIIFLFFIF